MEKTTSKPAWLAQLETESWQAELVISGIAIFASTFLPGLVDNLAAFCLVSIPPEDAALFQFVFMFFHFGTYCIIGGLVLHFTLRAFWIGMIGFNSVFPKGIDTEYEGYYSKYYTQKTAEHLPSNANNMIQNLDHFCSTIFAITASLLMVFFAFALNIGILYLLKLFLSLFLPDSIWQYVGYGILTVLFLSCIVMIVLNLDRFKKNDKAQHVFYRIGRITGLSMHVFYRPSQYIIMTIFTSESAQKYMSYFVVVYLLSSFSMGLSLVDTNFQYFTNYSPEAGYMHDFNRPDKVIPAHYANLRSEEEGRILSAILESDKITGEQFELFVPRFFNERKLYKTCIDELDTSNNISKEEERRLKYQQRLKCYKQYHHFTINGVPVQPLSILVMNHPNRGESGIQVQFSTQNLQKGENIIRIEKRHLETNELFRKIAIPFQFID